MRTCRLMKYLMSFKPDATQNYPTCNTEMSDLVSALARLASNGTNVGLFKIRFGEPKCIKSDLKKSQICPM